MFIRWLLKGNTLKFTFFFFQLLKQRLIITVYLPEVTEDIFLVVVSGCLSFRAAMGLNPPKVVWAAEEDGDLEDGLNVGLGLGSRVSTLGGLKPGLVSLC